MKKKSKKILGLFLLGVLIFSFIGIVSANNKGTQNSGNNIGVIKAIWDAFFGGLFDSNNSFSLAGHEVDISRILLIFLIVLLVYSIADFIPFFPEDKDYIKWLFSGAIAVLSFLFVSGEDIKMILTNYEALGVILTSIIPLVIILAFTFKMHKKHPRYANIINTPLLIAFGLYILFKWIKLAIDNQEGGMLRNVYLITLVIVGIFYIFKKDIFKWVEKEKLEAEIDIAEKQSKKINEERKLTGGEFDARTQYKFP